MDLKVLVENIGLRMIENCCVQIKMIYFCHRRKDSFGPKRSVCFGDVLESWCLFDLSLGRKRAWGYFLCTLVSLSLVNAGD